MKNAILSLFAVSLSLFCSTSSAQAESWKVVKEFLKPNGVIKDESAKCEYRLRYNYVDTFYHQPQTAYYRMGEAHSSPLGLSLRFPVNASDLVLPERFTQALGATTQASIKENFFDNSPYGFRSAYLVVESGRLPKLNLVIEGFLRSENNLTASGHPISSAFFTLEKRC